MDLSLSDYRILIQGGGVEPMVNQRFVEGMSNEMFEVKLIIDHLSIGLRTDRDVHFMWIFCWLAPAVVDNFFRSDLLQPAVGAKVNAVLISQSIDFTIMTMMVAVIQW